MKRWVLLLVLFALPVSSPMACGGDGCLRNSDCGAGELCSAGSCAPETPEAVAAAGGEHNAGGEGTLPTAGTSTAATAGASQAGSAGATSTGSAGSAGSESMAGQANGGDGGAAGALTVPSDEGGAGFGGALDLGGFGGAL
jgi:hypothetical protein